jgi:hypothetical protein
LVLEEVKVAPGLLLGVVHRALGAPHSGHENRAPRSKSIRNSSRSSASKEDSTTFHGAQSPSAA